MRFHMIDRIDHWDAYRRLSGRKVTSAEEAYWCATPTGPVMPGGLVLEALAQAGTWLLLLSSGFQRRAALGSVGQTRWLGEIVPGDVLELEVELTAHDEVAAVVDGTVNVAGRPVLEVSRLMCSLIPAEDLEDPAATERMARHLLREEVLR
jgi:3-hydroxyacyl-[acyl-carrier-protein] dehydratase